jgi:hypothetical protein
MSVSQTLVAIDLQGRHRMILETLPWVESGATPLDTM